MLPSTSHHVPEPDTLGVPGVSSVQINAPNQQTSSHVDLSKHPSGIVPQLQNVVSTCCLGRKLDLKFIAMHARNAEYNPKRFAAVIMRIREPKTTALIFSSGKMVCTGAKSESDSRLAARKFARTLQKLGFDDAKFQDFKVQNIVASCDVQFPIRLEGLHYKHGLFSSYEPELFPGLIYRMKKPKVVLLVFVSGKVVLTGAKHRGQIYQAFETIYPALTEFRKGEGLRRNLLNPSSDAVIPHKQEATNIAKAGSEPPALDAVRSYSDKVKDSNCANPISREAAENPSLYSMPSSNINTNYPPCTHAYPIPPPTPEYDGIPPPTPSYSLFQQWG